MVGDEELIGGYRVLRAVGAGGSARIDLVRMDRPYGFRRHAVIKRALDHRRDHAEVTASLRREARIGGRLCHPNLVAVLDAGTYEGGDYLVLEYVHGASLRTLVRREIAGTVRALPFGVALAIVAAAARGLHAAHELTDDDGEPLGLVHRDVSPGNVLIGFDGAVKITDFGSASETGAPRAGAHGTVTYMAPEHGQGRVVDRRADVFSLGVILYELVTGVRPFWADNDVASLHRVLSGAVAPPRMYQPAIPGELEAIVMAAIAHAPEHRFADAGALADTIEALAAAHGELLGPRVIARAMADMVGVRPLPWVSGGEVTGGMAVLKSAPVAMPVVVPHGGDTELERPSFGRTRRRGRGVLAGALALAVIGGGVAMAKLAGRRDVAAPAPVVEAQPAVGASATMVPAADRAARPAAAEAAGAEPAGSTAAGPPIAGPNAVEPAAGPTAAGPPAAEPAAAEPAIAAPAVGAPTAPPIIAKKRRAPPHHHVDPAPVPASPAPPAPATPAPMPATKSPSNVEWKPTLLLPSDGSASRPVK